MSFNFRLYLTHIDLALGTGLATVMRYPITMGLVCVLMKEISSCHEKHDAK